MHKVFLYLNELLNGTLNNYFYFIKLNPATRHLKTLKEKIFSNGLQFTYCQNKLGYKIFLMLNKVNIGPHTLITVLKIRKATLLLDVQTRNFLSCYSAGKL